MGRRNKGLSFYKKRKTISISTIKEIFSWLFLLALAILISFVFTFSIGIKTSVIGTSMEPGLKSGQSVLINKIVYGVGSPKRNDVVVFLPNGNENTHYYIKRVIGLPGEKITIQDGRILINGFFFEEDGDFDKIEDGGIAENGIVLGDEEYFLLGDNRNSSEDSRSANIGPVKEENIIGKAWFHVGKALDELGFID